MSHTKPRSLLEELARLTGAFGIIFLVGLALSLTISNRQPTFAAYWEVTGSFVVILWSVTALGFVIARRLRSRRKDA
jgi:hypothetical protein